MRPSDAQAPWHSLGCLLANMHAEKAQQNANIWHGLECLLADARADAAGTPCTPTPAWAAGTARGGGGGGGGDARRAEATTVTGRKKMTPNAHARWKISASRPAVCTSSVSDTQNTGTSHDLGTPVNTP